VTGPEIFLLAVQLDIEEVNSSVATEWVNILFEKPNFCTRFLKPQKDIPPIFHGILTHSVAATILTSPTPGCYWSETQIPHNAKNNREV